jgi:hypothetical protein
MIVAEPRQEAAISLFADEALSPFFNCRSSAARMAARAAASFFFALDLVRGPSTSFGACR